MRVTSKVWPETVVVVLEEAVQQLGHVVGGLVGEDGVGHLCHALVSPLWVAISAEDSSNDELNDQLN